MSNQDFILKDEAKKVMEMTLGDVRAVTLQTHFRYIREKEGEEGLRKVLDKFKELGYPMDPAKLKPLDWVKTALADLAVIVAKYTFGWEDKDVFDMGNQAPKYSLIVKLFLKTFLSLKRVFQECPKYWAKHFTEGTLKATEFNDKEKYLILHLKHSCHPIICIFYAGYFLRIGQYVMTQGTKITIEETKCMSKGSPYHEFLIRWE